MFAATPAAFAGIALAGEALGGDLDRVADRYLKVHLAYVDAEVKRSTRAAAPDRETELAEDGAIDELLDQLQEAESELVLRVAPELADPTAAMTKASLISPIVRAVTAAGYGFVVVLDRTRDEDGAARVYHHRIGSQA